MPATALVQHVEWSTNTNGEASGGNAFKWVLPELTLAGNMGKFTLYYPNTATISSISDDAGNTYPTTPDVSANDTSNAIIHGVFHSFNLAAGARVITVTFSAVQFGVSAKFQEWCGIATTSALDNVAGAASAFNLGASVKGGVQNINAGATYTPTTSGDLIFQDCYDTGNGTNAMAGHADGVVSIVADPTFTVAQIDPIQAFISSYQLQPLAMSANPTTVVASQSQNNGWTSIVYGIKTDNTKGTAPSTTAQRVVGALHCHIETQNGNFTYNLPYPTYGTLLVVAISDPGGSTTLNSFAGSFAGTGVVRTNATSNAQMGYIKHGRPNANEVLTIGANDAAHGYYQGIIYDVVNSGNFDTDVDGGLAAFGPGNSPSASFTPGVSNGLAINVTGNSTGPPDSMSSPTGAIFLCGFYTNMTDLSFMDNGDFHGKFNFTTSAAQSWVFHNTAATSGAGYHIASFTLGPIITAQPTNQFAYPGQSITFSVTATASGGSNTYQWRRNGTNIASATSASYTFSPNWQTDYGATFDVIVTDSNGAQQSVPVQVVWVPESSLSYNDAVRRPARYTGNLQLNAYDVGDQDYKSELTLLRWF